MSAVQENFDLARHKLLLKQTERQLHQALSALARIESAARASRDLEMWELRPLMAQIVEVARKEREREPTFR